MKPGDVLDGRFHIQRQAASGGAGVVFRATDRQSGAAVAIKSLRSEADPRFAREVETLAGLRHPAIVAYLAHGRFEDELYLAMEWLEGEDLGTRLRAAELTVAEALAVAGQIAEALAVAHRRGIVHRDIKPSNVFLVDRRPERVKLLDFGLARHAGRATLTMSGVVVGTPIYMAPEQARGNSLLDARADVYGLGALLFRCLAGRPPFDGGTVEQVIARVLTEKAPRLRDHLPGVTPDLEALVASMLAKVTPRPTRGSRRCTAASTNGAVAARPCARPGIAPAARRWSSRRSSPSRTSPAATR